MKNIIAKLKAVSAFLFTEKKIHKRKWFWPLILVLVILGAANDSKQQSNDSASDKADTESAVSSETDQQQPAAKESDTKVVEPLLPTQALDASRFANQSINGRCVAVLEKQSRQMMDVNPEASAIYADVAKKLTSYSSKKNKDEFQQSKIATESEIQTQLTKGPAAQNWYIENVINQSADCADQYRELQQSSGDTADATAVNAPQAASPRMKVYDPIDEWYQLVCTGQSGVPGIRAREINCGRRIDVMIALEQAFNWLRRNRDSLPSDVYEDICWNFYRQIKEMPSEDVMPWGPDSGAVFIQTCSYSGLVEARQWVEQQRR